MVLALNGKNTASFDSKVLHFINKESAPYLNDFFKMMSFIFHTMRASISSSEHQNFPSDGIWFLLTTGYPGEPKHLGDPRECIIDMTAGGEADRSLSTGIREGAFVLGSRLTPLSVTSTKGYISFALEKTALLARRFHSRDN